MFSSCVQYIVWQYVTYNVMWMSTLLTILCENNQSWKNVILSHRSLPFWNTCHYDIDLLTSDKGQINCFVVNFGLFVNVYECRNCMSGNNHLAWFITIWQIGSTSVESIVLRSISLAVRGSVDNLSVIVAYWLLMLFLIIFLWYSGIQNAVSDFLVGSIFESLL